MSAELPRPHALPSSPTPKADRAQGTGTRPLRGVRVLGENGLETGRAELAGTGQDLCLRSPLTRTAASQHVEFSTPGGPPIQFPPKPPPFPLFVLLPSPSPSSSGDGPLPRGRPGGLARRLSEFLREGTNSGHPDCRLRDGRSEPSPHPACFAPHPPGARLSPGLSCFTAYLSFRSPASLVGGTGEAAAEGSTQEPDTVRGAEGNPLWLSHVLGDCLGVASGPWPPETGPLWRLQEENPRCPGRGLGAGNAPGQVLSVGVGWGPGGF